MDGCAPVLTVKLGLIGRGDCVAALHRALLPTIISGRHAGDSRDSVGNKDREAYLDDAPQSKLASPDGGTMVDCDQNNANHCGHINGTPDHRRVPSQLQPGTNRSEHHTNKAKVPCFVSNCNACHRIFRRCLFSGHRLERGALSTRGSGDESITSRLLNCTS